MLGIAVINQLRTQVRKLFVCVDQDMTLLFVFQGMALIFVFNICVNTCKMLSYVVNDYE